MDLKSLSIGLALGWAVAFAGWADALGQPVSHRDTFSDTWVATDALGRTLPDFGECGGPKRDRTVGIFYFLWMQKHAGHPVYDISKLLKQNPQHPAWGPEKAFHWWGEPYLGYYLSDDEFVIRKHAQMLSDAGVDVVIFDVTNAATYDSTFMAVCRVYEQIRREGGRTPQIAFITHSRPGQVVRHLYDTFYAKNLYPDLWFRWQNKPLLLGDEGDADGKIKDFFAFRASWAWTKSDGWFGNGKDKWPWLDHSPQKFGWHDSPDKPEQISVSVAEHPISNIGRSHHDGKQPPPDQLRTAEGPYFAEQWRRALQIDPPFVFVTGWNEWIAQRFISTGGGMRMGGKPLQPGDSFFVDEYSEEFSRDIEPMRGGHGDDFYYQLAANVRRYKGVRPPPRSSAAKTIRIDYTFYQWADVRPDYLDDLFDTTHRNHAGFGDAGPYVNNSGRNDFDTLKVARDDQNIYFYARTREALTPPAGQSWMTLLLDTDCNHATGWEGYDFLINRDRGSADTCTVERNLGGWKWQKVADAKIAWLDHELHLSIPRKALGLEKSPLRFDFKWADNLPDRPTAMNFIDQGDVAPNGRFNYRYRE